MINTHALRSLIFENGMSQEDVAKKIGISTKTFYNKMKKGVFGSDEISEMIKILNIENPAEIFFAETVT